MEDLESNVTETRPENEQERRRLLLWIASGILVFALFLCIGQIAIMLQGPQVRASAISQLDSDYGPWPLLFFAPLNPAVMGELGLLGQPAFSPNCFIIAPGCALNRTPTPIPTSTPTQVATTTPSLTPTATETPTLTPTATNTLIPSATPTITYTPSNTPTPTPQVYPIKLADQQNFPPGSWTVLFDIIVINYGSIPPADLTTVIDRLPAGMTLVPGSCNPSGCTTSMVGGRQVITWNLIVSIPQGGFYRLSFRGTVEGTSPGDILTNEVETQGSNFQTSVNYRTVYVYTATPTPTITVVPGAVDDSAVTNEDVSVDIDVLANDSGLRDTPITVSIQSGPANGSALVLVNNEIRYSPDPNYFNNPPGGDLDSFVYRVTDDDGQFSTATVTVTVNSVNDTPAAVADSAITPEDIPINIAVLANDTGIGDTPLTVVVLGGGPSNGTAVVLGNNTITYTPELNYDGPDSFSYRVTDNDGQSSTALVSIDVTPPINDPPLAVNDGPYVFDEDSIDNIITHADLLSNDTDVENDPLTVVLFSGPTYGTVVFNDNLTPADPTDDYFEYTPTPNYFGADSFTYRAYDGQDYSNVATVSLTVNNLNDTPLAVDDSADTPEDVPIALDVIDYASGTNDTGVTDLPITVTIISGPTNGTVSPPTVVDSSFPPDATFTYTPNANWFGVDSFDYRITDADFEFSDATVTVTVTEVNDPPVAVNDTPEDIPEDPPEPVSIAVLANDYDVDGILVPGTVTIIAFPTNGTIVNEVGGVVSTGIPRYDPDTDYNGPDSFTYTVEDDDGAVSNVATVNLIVTPEDDVPVAINDIAHTDVGEPVNIYILSNDLGLGDTPLTVTLVPPNASDGTPLVFGSPGLPGAIYIRYTPDPLFFGSDSFHYQVCDSDSPCDTGHVDVFINDPPTANNDPENDTLEDTPITVNVLANDIDVDDGLDTSSVVIRTQPTNGTAVVNPGGTITYTPDPDYFGPDDLEYTVDDLNVPPATSNYATVLFNVISVNDPPTAVDDSYSTDENTLLAVPALGVLGNDTDIDVGDVLSANPLTGPSNAAAFTLSADGSFNYLPSPGFSGTDSFTYEACDLSAACDPATVTIDVNGAPTALDDGPYSVNEDASISVGAPGVLGNDSDPESDPLQALLASGPSNGSLSLSSNGSFTYTPFADYYGPDSFTYRANDGSANSNIATVSITVVSVDDLPVAVDDNPSVAEDTPTSIDLLANDSELGDAPITLSQFGAGPTNGSVDFSSGNPVLYSPDPDYFGPDSFGYQICDVDGDCDTATVNVTVTSVNDPPTANDDSGSTVEDTPVVIDVAGNDTDSDGFVVPATVATATPPGNGSAIPNGDGTITYSPNLNFFGTDTFTYTIDDDQGGTSNAATVTVDVAALNDPPQANADSVSTFQATAITINVVANDVDVDGSIVASTVQIVTGPSNGSAVNNGDGTVTYTPNQGSFTSDSFTYNVQDNVGAVSNDATVTINITPPTIGVVKEANPSSASIGDTIDFLIYIWNDGPGIAYGAQLSDTLGSCFTFLTANPSGALGDIAEGGAIVRIALARVIADTSCDNTNSVSVSSINGANGNAWVSVSLAGSGSGSGFSTPTPPASSSSSTPAPTATPVPPTSTPTPPAASSTSTPAPTATPVPPTSSPTPTATYTPTASLIPPTDTATPLPSPTPTPTPG